MIQALGLAPWVSLLRRDKRPTHQRTKKSAKSRQGLNLVSLVQDSALNAHMPLWVKLTALVLGIALFILLGFSTLTMQSEIKGQDEEIITQIDAQAKEAQQLIQAKVNTIDLGMEVAANALQINPQSPAKALQYGLKASKGQLKNLILYSKEGVPITALNDQGQVQAQTLTRYGGDIVLISNAGTQRNPSDTYRIMPVDNGAYLVGVLKKTPFVGTHKALKKWYWSIGQARSSWPRMMNLLASQCRMCLA